MRKAMVLFVAAALLSTAGMAADLAGIAYVKDGGWPTETPDTPDGENQPEQMDGSEVCCQFQDDGTCDFASGGPYNPGDSVTVNTYWNETLDNDEVQYTVDWTAGLRIPNGNIIVLFDGEPVNFGDIPAGSYRFCSAFILELPAACTGGALVTHGHGVDTPNGPALPPGPSDPDSTDDTWICS